MKHFDMNPLIWIIDVEHWPRAYLRAELIERGCYAVGYETAGEVLSALKTPQSTIPAAIVLELRGQRLSEANLRDLHQSRIPVIILGGAVELNEPHFSCSDWSAVLRRPFSIGKVAETVIRVIGM